MMKKHVWSLLLCSAFAFLLSACGKELSFEGINTPSAGSLQSATTGDCLPKTVAGVYEEGVSVDPATHYIEVSVDVTKAGSYTIYTDTLNGMYFRAQGFFAGTGPTAIKLTGYGKPTAPGNINYIVTYNGTECDIAVPVLPAGASGPATFAYVGAPNNCSGAVPAGDYGQGIPLNATNTVTVSVNVSVIGTYNVTTTTNNGITFKGQGVFLTTGANTIELKGEGTPVAAGNFDIAIAGAPATICKFPVTVLGPAAFTADCASATVNGTYRQTVALNATNTIDLDVTVTTAGAYSITTALVSGIRFSGSGSFPAAGNYTITLNGTGTPTASGTVNVTYTAGTTNCDVDVTVATAPPNPDMKWEFKIGTTLYEGPTDVATVVSAGPGTSASITGSSSSGSITLSLVNPTGGISTGAYSGTSVTGKLCQFGFNGTSYNLIASPGGGTNLSANVTTYNTTTKVIEGTFSGTASDILTSTTVTITNGKFKAQLP